MAHGMSKIPRKAREAVRKRDLRCVVCMSQGYDIHHRQRRREGGHGLDNMILLCRSCHERAHKHPEWARERGFIVSVYSDPGETPLKTYSGWVALRADGSLEFLTDLPEGFKVGQE